MNSLIQTPSYCTRTDYGAYKQLLLNGGYGDVQLTSVYNGNVTQVCVTFSSSDKHLFMPGMFYTRSEDNLIAISGLVRILGSAKFGTEEDIPNPWTLPYQFDIFGLLEAVAVKYAFTLDYTPVDLGDTVSHKIIITEGAEKKRFSASNPDHYIGKCTVAKNALTWFMNNLKEAPVIEFEKEWFVSTDEAQKASYDWFFNYKKPKPVIEGLKVTCDGNKYVESDDDEIQVTYPGMSLIQVSIVRENVVCYQIEGFKKVRFTLGQTGIKFRTEPETTFSLVVSAGGSNTMEYFRLDYDDDTDNSAHYNQDDWRTMVVKKMKLFADKEFLPVGYEEGELYNPLIGNKEYVHMHDYVDISLFKVIQDMLVVTTEHERSLINRVSSMLYKILVPYSTNIVDVVTIKYGYVRKFIELANYQHWFSYLEDILRTEWYISPCLTVIQKKTLPVSVITPILHADIPYFEASTSDGDCYQIKFVKGTPVKLDGTRLPVDVESRLFNDRVSVCCDSESFINISRFPENVLVPARTFYDATCNGHTHKTLIPFEVLAPEPVEEGGPKYRSELSTVYFLEDKYYILKNLYGIKLTPYRRMTMQFPGVGGTTNKASHFKFRTVGGMTTIELGQHGPLPQYLHTGNGNSVVFKSIPCYFQLISCKEGFVIKAGNKFLTITNRKYVYFAETIRYNSVFNVINARERLERENIYI